MFMEYYRRASDGAIVRFGCSYRASNDAVLAIVRSKREAHLVEKTAVINDNGANVGERVVWNSTDPSDEAVIRWNEGSCLFSIHAHSLANALTFEKSKVWAGAGCWDARSW
jgi:hypothetical protein